MATALSFAGGFLLANALNRGEIDQVKGENARLRLTQSEEKRDVSDITLSNEEIQKKINEADQNAGNFKFQKNLGLALYRYSAMKKDAEILSNAVRLLERANAIDSLDRDVHIGLGHAYFDHGYYNKDNKSFETAREFYSKALTKMPGDAEIRTELGLTYYLQEPPRMNLAVEQFEASLKIDSTHEKTLQFLVQSLVKQNEGERAKQYLDQLKKVNPDSEALPELSAIVAQAAGSPVK
ncbi:MAG: hypothetical protein WKF92_01425 [Pyrinomonadaceae bacterium]